ncbi:hypothetical protein [Massilia timonae]|uniref:Uncharacterized protein n=1 Tax=Massilia timonae CCUG 45783 TaxID=883126 RepID=K9DZR1_9BURK|nr:hypothetical protein [Massilia timonae]EKU82700.1 hypothetical protein HMPREF9710_02015 [Massilia timonae CCUG 45783]
MNRAQDFVVDASAGSAALHHVADDGGHLFVRFMACGAGVVAAGIALVLACTVLVDPYRLFGLAEIDGINRIKPQPERYREEIKLAHARAVQPNMLFFGNSRTEIGFDPDSPILRERGLSAYNMGLAGTRLAASQRMLDDARDSMPAPAMAIVGVEFLDFLVDASALPLPAPAAEHGFQSMPWQWRFDTVFSLNALADSFATLRIQDVPEAQVMSHRGHNPLREYHGFARKEGYFSIFQQRAQENAKNLAARPRDLFLPGAADSDSTERLRAMLDRMARESTEVHVVIYPYHAQLMAMFEAAGLQGALEEWKRLLVRETDMARARHDGTRITVWDFSGYGPIQCERIPSAGDRRSTTQWYWEGGHFKSTLGELMLRRMLGGGTDAGFLLTATTLEQNAQRVAAERAQCAGMYPEVFASAQNLVIRARKQLR